MNTNNYVKQASIEGLLVLKRPEHQDERDKNHPKLREIFPEKFR